MHLLDKNERISVSDLFKLRSEREPHLLIDVRSKAEYDMCHLPESINLSINALDKNADYLIQKIKDLKCITDDPKSKLISYSISNFCSFLIFFLFFSCIHLQARQ